MKNTNIERSLPRQGVLRVLMRFLFRLIITALVFAFCFYLIILSNMGGAYFPNINDGALDIPIRIALIGISAWIAFSAVTWLVWQIFQDIKKAYKTIKNQRR